jgi:hypothetical protein
MTARDICLRGNMGSASFYERGSAKNDRRGRLSRAEIIRNVRAARPAIFKPRKRIANVKRLPSINGFHVVGLGNIAQITLGELKAKLRVGNASIGFRGCSAMRLGGLMFSTLK